MIQDSSGNKLNYNPFLAQARARATQSSNERAASGGDAPARGSIDAPNRAVGNFEANITWQTRDHAATEYENKLGDALEAAFESGADSADAMATHLNSRGVYAPDGTPWTSASFEAVMRELGA